MTKLSIIVPVYNLEEYIRPCIESIFRQGLDDAGEFLTTSFVQHIDISLKQKENNEKKQYRFCRHMAGLQ